MRNIVDKIPADRIKEIVDKNIIANAVPLASNAYMKFLWVIWYNYIEPGGSGEINCMFCVTNVLNNFRNMQDAIVEAHRDNQKLESL